MSLTSSTVMMCCHISMQLYVSCHPDNINDVRLQLSACAADVSKWCASRHLQMNSDETEIVWFGSRAQLAKLAVHDCSLQIGAETVQPASAARVLGVLFDSELTMKSHMAGTASACFYHLRRLRQIRRRVGEDVAMRLVLALITSRLDYCKFATRAWPGSRSLLSTPCSGCRTRQLGSSSSFSDGKFPEIFTGGKFPETFPTMFAHRFLVAYFLTVLSMLP
jgi:hypothetical protein